MRKDGNPQAQTTTGHPFPTEAKGQTSYTTHFTESNKEKAQYNKSFMEYRNQNKITTRNRKKIINSRCKKCCFESNYNFDTILCYFYLNTSLQKYTVISIK